MHVHLIMGVTQVVLNNVVHNCFNFAGVRMGSFFCSSVRVKLIEIVALDPVRIECAGGLFFMEVIIDREGGSPVSIIDYVFHCISSSILLFRIIV